MDAGEIVARGRALIGTRFRAQGREPGLGLDCIGVAAAMFGMAGVRRDYCLRSGEAGVVNAEFAACGFRRLAVTEAGAGDVLLVRVGPAQLHVVILTPEGYLHADAGLQRVVEVPGAVAWPVASAWRQCDEEESPSPRSPGGESPPQPSTDLRSAEPLAAPPSPEMGEG